MVSETFAALGIDSNAAKAELADLEQRTNRWATKWKQLKSKVAKEASTIMGSITALIGVVRAVATAMGVLMSPAEEALLTMISTAATSMVAIAAAFTSTGIGTVAGAIFAAAAMGIAIGTYAIAVSDMGYAKQQSMEAIGVANSLTGLARSFTWLGGS